MVCSICNNAIKKDLKIDSIEPDLQVPAYDNYTISVTVKSLAWAYGDTAKLCLYDRATGELISSQSEHMGPGSSKLFVFNESMPNHDHRLNLSLIDENVWPISDDCEDYRNFTIKEGRYKPPGSDYGIILWVVLAVVAAMIIIKLVKK
jgi:hypothetical protein